MARFGVKEEEKLLVMKYIIGLSPYIQQEMEFLTISMLADAFHYASKLEAKQKGKIRFVNKPTGRTSDKKSQAESDKFNNLSQSTLLNPNHQKNNFHKDNRYHSKQAPTGKGCYYHSSTWHDMSECKY